MRERTESFDEHFCRRLSFDLIAVSSPSFLSFSMFFELVWAVLNQNF